VVCAAVMILRRKRPDAPRPFRVPAGNLFPILGVVSCVYLMVNLTIMTWVRFLVWLDLGMVIYWFYGRTHSPLHNAAEAAARSAMQNFGNFLKIAGYMLLFNGFCITLLAYLTEFGITTEELAKWHELDALLSKIGGHVTPEIADALGLKILLTGAIVTVAGLVMARGAKPSGVGAGR
jgi:amino acid transporter